ncbi:MAG TPA: hypothetical protein VJ810_11920 [Blastocatellia bacterium]|nr:hypothetical protein [Blastocatellia bacterium]
MKKLFLRCILILAALSVAPGAGYAQAAQDTPESVAKAYFAAMQGGDWAKCASLMHADALASLKRTFSAVIIADKSGEAAKSIFGLKNAAEYAQLSETVIFERMMSFMTGSSPEMKAVLAASTTLILGKVDESPELTHIVFRTQIKLSGAEMDEVDLMSFKKQGTTWRALLTPELEETFTKFAEGMTRFSKEEGKNKGAERKP